MRLSKFFSLSLLLVSNLWIGGAFAAGNNPCRDDAKKFCHDVKPGDHRIAQCLTQHAAELSSACQQFRQARQKKIDEVSHACQNDIATHCANIAPGGGRMAQCLKSKQSQLTPACKNQLQQATG
ncbi:MAG: hypothetical protein HY308_06265 [Gammaproteobacteria bacterium]|nr:hypothetical protein [Gammaproteobacteria bacterium]